VTFKCLNCGATEDISHDIVEFLDGTDIEYNPNSAPQFSCDKCDGVMYPVFYRNQLGKEFRINDV
jgi:predicted nucleic-acid-binding Zn-ribbon protein